VSQPKFRPSSAQQKTNINLPHNQNKVSQDLPKAEAKAVRPASGYKLTKG